MNEFDGIKVGEIYTTLYRNHLKMCVNIEEARPYGKTGKMFSNITYMIPHWGGTYKWRHISGTDTGWITLNEKIALNEKL